jgi:hypothetical protein
MAEVDVSRKGAKTQRTRKEDEELISLRFLCAIAALRETQVDD